MKEQDYLIVDLGLPSGLKWADRNVGADTPQDKGLYFDWGNVDGHDVDENGNVIDGYSFDRDTYPNTLGGQYTGGELDAEHDAATVNMGEKWRMPTSSEIRELIQETDHYYIDLEENIINKDGFVIDESGNTTEDKIEFDVYKKLHSICFVKKDEKFIYNYNVDQRNFIEIPFAGFCYGSLLDYDGLCGVVWSSSVDDNFDDLALYLFFNSGGYLLGGLNYNRYSGRSVRGVTSNNKIK